MENRGASAREKVLHLWLVQNEVLFYIDQGFVFSSGEI